MVTMDCNITKVKSTTFVFFLFGLHSVNIFQSSSSNFQGICIFRFDTHHQIMKKLISAINFGINYKPKATTYN